jgi:predicted metal-binding protein
LYEQAGRTGRDAIAATFAVSAKIRFIFCPGRTEREFALLRTMAEQKGSAANVHYSSCLFVVSEAW